MREFVEGDEIPRTGGRVETPGRWEVVDRLDDLHWLALAKEKADPVCQLLMSGGASPTSSILGAFLGRCSWEALTTTLRQVRL